MLKAIGWVPILLVGALVRGAAEYRHDGNSKIALVDPLGIPPMNVVNLLKSHGIHAYAYGSQLYCVEVPAAKAKEARKILIADAVRHPYLYEYIEGYKGKLGFPSKMPWIVRKLNINLSDIERSRILHSDPNLLGLAREAQQYLGETVHLEKSTGPYIESMKLFPMEYVDDTGTIESGYWAEVDVRYRLGKGQCECYSYVWDHGRRHVSSGGGSADAL